MRGVTTDRRYCMSEYQRQVGDIVELTDEGIDLIQHHKNN